MRVLLTGAGGFAAPHVAAALRETCGADVAIIATARHETRHPALGAVAALDVTDRAAVAAMVRRVAPTHVLHLAGIAAPAAANADPDAAWRVHLGGTRNLAAAILESVPDCRLLNVGSGMVYGASAAAGSPLDEAMVLAPIDDYAASKAAADLALGALAQRGLRCVRLRPFNHVGPGQSEAFALPAFAMQIARIEAGLMPPVLRVGNLCAERDFLDVRDVARAYALAARESAALDPGDILNVASGSAWRIEEVLARLLAQSGAAITVERDPTRLRPGDLPRIVGDAGRARARLGWAPAIPLDATLGAVLAACRARVAEGRG